MKYISIVIILIIIISCNNNYRINEEPNNMFKPYITNDFLLSFEKIFIKGSYEYLNNSYENEKLAKYLEDNVKEHTKIFRLMILGDLLRYSITPDIDTIAIEDRDKYDPEDYFLDYYVKYIYYFVFNNNKLRILYLNIDSALIDTSINLENTEYYFLFDKNINEKLIFRKTEGNLCFLSIKNKIINKTIVLHGFYGQNTFDTVLLNKNKFLKGFYWLENFFEKYELDKNNVRIKDYF